MMAFLLKSSLESREADITTANCSASNAKYVIPLILFAYQPCANRCTLSMCKLLSELIDHRGGVDCIFEVNASSKTISGQVPVPEQRSRNLTA